MRHTNVMLNENIRLVLKDIDIRLRTAVNQWAGSVNINWSLHNEIPVQ